MDVVLAVSARLLLALVFAVAGLAKLDDLPGSRKAVRDFGVPEAVAGPAGVALPLAELAIAVALIPTPTAVWGALGALILLLLFIAGMGLSLARGKTPDCHCFGQLHSEPIGRSTIVRNALLSLVALFILAESSSTPGAGAAAWLGRLTPVEGLALGVAVCAVASAIAGWWLLIYPPAWLADRLPSRFTAMVETPKRQPDQTVLHEGDRPPGLPVGTVAPRFRLPGLYGEMMTLDALRAGGRAVMLIFVSPSCGPCRQLMPDLARWQCEYSPALNFVLVSSGTAEENRAKGEEHGLTQLLLQKNFAAGNAYEAVATPSAVIVHPSGTIASPVAAGTDQIRTLLDQYVELLAAEVGIELEDEGEYVRAARAAAEPFDPGSPAPELERLDGSSETTRSQRVAFIRIR